ERTGRGSGTGEELHRQTVDRDRARREGRTVGEGRRHGGGRRFRIELRRGVAQPPGGGGREVAGGGREQGGHRSGEVPLFVRQTDGRVEPRGAFLKALQQLDMAVIEQGRDPLDVAAVLYFLHADEPDALLRATDGLFHALA